MMKISRLISAVFALGMIGSSGVMASSEETSIIGYPTVFKRLKEVLPVGRVEIEAIERVIKTIGIYDTEVVAGRGKITAFLESLREYGEVITDRAYYWTCILSLQERVKGNETLRDMTVRELVFGTLQSTENIGGKVPDEGDDSVTEEFTESDDERTIELDEPSEDEAKFSEEEPLEKEVEYEDLRYEEAAGILAAKIGFEKDAEIVLRKVVVARGIGDFYIRKGMTVKVFVREIIKSADSTNWLGEGEGELSIEMRRKLERVAAKNGGAPLFNFLLLWADTPEDIKK